MVSSERTVTLVPAAVDPPGDARPDWRLIADVACAMGFAADFTYALGRGGVRRARPGSPTRPPATTCRGVTLRAAARDAGPVAGAASVGPIATRMRYRRRRRRAAVRDAERPGRVPPSPARRAGRAPDDEHPFVFNTGRLPHQWHTMTKTGKVARLNRLDDGPFVEVHPADAAALGVADGDLVEVASRRGRAVLPAVVTDRVQPGNVFAPIHWNDLHGEYAARQRGDQRRRRSALVAARAEGLRRVAHPCRQRRRPLGRQRADARRRRSASPRR